MDKKKKRGHPCKGCVWGTRILDKIFCPLPTCVRVKPDTKNTTKKG